MGGCISAEANWLVHKSLEGFVTEIIPKYVDMNGIGKLTNYRSEKRGLWKPTALRQDFQMTATRLPPTSRHQMQDASLKI
jgi:hypothetical protein